MHMWGGIGSGVLFQHGQRLLLAWEAMFWQGRDLYISLFLRACIRVRTHPNYLGTFLLRKVEDVTTISKLQPRSVTSERIID